MIRKLDHVQHLLDIALPMLHFQANLLFPHVLSTPSGVTGRDEHGRDEHCTGLGSDWIRAIANFVEFGLDLDCKSLQNLGTGPDLD